MTGTAAGYGRRSLDPAEEVEVVLPPEDDVRC